MKVLLAMSGGVDSSVAGALLLEQGHDVVGVTMKLWGGDSDTGCCSVSDVDDARRVAQQLGIDHLVFNFGDDFDAHVVQPYVAAHAAGVTPEPVHRVQPAPQVRPAAASAPTCSASTPSPPATTPASVAAPTARYTLERGADPAKDQSYVRAHARPGGAGAHAVPGRRHRQGRGAPARRRARPAHRGEARQPGRVLHHLDGGRDDVPRRPHRRSAAAASSTPRRDGGRGRRRSRWSRSASGAASACPGGGPKRYVVDVDVAGGDRGGRRRRRPAARAHVTVAGVGVGRRAGRAVRCACSAAPTARRSPATIERRRRRHASLRARGTQPQRRVAPGQSVVFYDVADRCVLGGGLAAR